MKQFNLNSKAEVQQVFDNYPSPALKRMQELRSLIIESASELEEVYELEETLKWGEPSYISKYGSTLRIDWKQKAPDQFAMYFKCTSKLVETFREVYPNDFSYEGNRAIVFKLDETIPKEKLKECIKATLRYHKVKKLPLLGMGVK